MKRIYKTVLFLLFTSSCALEKEPLIPTGVSNEQLPIFTSTKINFDDNKVLVAEAELSTLGNIQIKTFGWVWDSLPVPSVKNDAKLEFGNLSRKTFSSKIENLTDGPIFIRPFAVTYSDTVYGLEQNYMVGGINIEFIEPEIFENASIVFKNTTKSMNQYQWTWNFGDGFVSNSPSPTHVFNKKGVIRVQVEAKKEGIISTKEISFRVVDDPFSNYWVSLPGGSFTMGCNIDYAELCDSDESPSHQVILSPFEIGKTEITQRQWIAVMGYNPSFFIECGLDCPAELVDWMNIRTNFIPKLNRKTGRIHRLPTEAEWEYAARGGKAFIYAGSNIPNEVGWYYGNSGFKTHQVGLKPPNDYGLYDMTGNVWEWCSDYYSSTYYKNSPILNPQGPSSSNSDLRIRRGGSFATDIVNDVDDPRVSYRNYYSHFQANYTIGFRLVRVN